jgi:hypothetical protein
LVPTTALRRKSALVIDDSEPRGIGAGRQVAALGVAHVFFAVGSDQAGVDSSSSTIKDGSS